MAEAQAAPEQAPAASTPAETPKQESSLEDVYKTFKVDEMAKEFQATPQPKEQPQERQEVRQERPQISIPDPVLDPAGHKAFVERSASESANIKQALRELKTQLSERDRAAFQEREEADIRKAVGKVNDHLGDAKLPDDFVEVALGVEAKRDPRFFTIWNNRTKNPQAYEAAVKAFAGKLGKTYALRADPQLAENQRALREATSTKATTAPEKSQDEKLAALQGKDFERAMARIREGNSPF
jgi:hypothetical protein